MSSKSNAIITCPSCRTKNRVPIERMSQRPRCGRCKAPLLSGTSGPVTITDANFQLQVLSSVLPVLVDCWAPWCGPCHIVGPIIDALAKEFEGKVLVGKLNVDENPRVANMFNIQSIPTILIFKDGRQVDRLVGAVPKEEILARLKPYL